MYTIEKAKKNDIEKIFNFLKENIDMYEELQAVDYSKVLQFVYNDITQHYKDYYKILINSSVIGYYSFLKGNDEYELNGLYIDGKYCGKGIGTSLIKKFINESEHNHMPITLYVFSDNIKAIHFYQKNGFVIIKHYKTRLLMKRTV